MLWRQTWVIYLWKGSSCTQVPDICGTQQSLKPNKDLARILRSSIRKQACIYFRIWTENKDFIQHDRWKRAKVYIYRSVRQTVPFGINLQQICAMYNTQNTSKLELGKDTNSKGKKARNNLERVLTLSSFSLAEDVTTDNTVNESVRKLISTWVTCFSLGPFCFEKIYNLVFQQILQDKFCGIGVLFLQTLCLVLSGQILVITRFCSVQSEAKIRPLTRCGELGTWTNVECYVPGNSKWWLTRTVLHDVTCLLSRPLTSEDISLHPSL